MTADEDRPPCIAELYSLATQSSHLKFEARCDLDFLIAAGKMQEGIGPTLMRLRIEFDAVRAMARRDGALNSAERVQVLTVLKTLPAARRELGAFAYRLVNRTDEFLLTDIIVFTIAGRVLDTWLDPRCHACEGRGFTGGTHRGEQSVKCRGCRGTGDRRSVLGDTALEKRFAAHLVDKVAEMLRRTEGEMAMLLRQLRPSSVAMVETA